MAGTDMLDSPLRPAALGGEGRAELEDACVDLKARASNDDLSARSSLALWEECNPDASNDRASYVVAVVVDVAEALLKCQRVALHRTIPQVRRQILRATLQQLRRVLQLPCTQHSMIDVEDSARQTFRQQDVVGAHG